MSKRLGEFELAPENVEVVPSTEFASTLKSLRLSQDFESLVDVKPVVTEVTIGKPNRQTFFRVHPEWKAGYPILELKLGTKSEFYVVAPKAATEIEDEVHPRLIVPAITRDGRLYVWPLRLGDGERLDNAASSALKAMRLAKEQWIKVKWNGHEFVTSAARKELSSPVWPEIGFDKMLDIAFKDRFISSPDHPVIKSLLGDE
ncbi:MAG: hypothetical protein WBE76_11830 [Terracidiphilus sp.]